MIKKILNAVITLALVVWVIIVGIDFYNVSQSKKPQFCIDKDTRPYDDGTVEICTGVGYKVFDYKRTSINRVEFGPFWLKEKTSNF